MASHRRDATGYATRVALLAGLAGLVTLPVDGQSGLRTRDRASLRATSPTGDESFALPTDRRLWHNSPPMDLESLSGKGVVFYFFEEQSEAVERVWPQLQGSLKQYEGKPIFFVAVNSGTEPRALKRYLAQNRVVMPVIHDYDRSLEIAMGVPKLTPTGEVAAVKYVSAEGRLASGKITDFAGTAEAALKGAEWRVDPSEVPSKLRNAWMSIELGHFEAAARAVTKEADSKDENIKAAAEKLLAAVKEEATEEAKAAKASLTEGAEWTGYQQLRALGERYKGYEFPLLESAEAKAKQLAKSDAIKREIAANKLIDKALSTAAKGTNSAIKRATGLLERVVSDYADSEAATRAKELLASAGR